MGVTQVKKRGDIFVEANFCMNTPWLEGLWNWNLLHNMLIPFYIYRQ